MARNTYEIDEKLETPFNASHFKRSFKYVKMQLPLLLLSLLLNSVNILIGLLNPLFTSIIIDKAIVNSDYKLLWIIGLIYITTITVSQIFNYIQSRVTVIAGQRIVHNIREDLFEHLQKLPFDYYDTRPHGKILVRVVNYVNNVATFLSNGLVNIVIQLLNIVFILFFMFFMNVKLSFVILSGLPFLIGFLFLIKKRQRKVMQNVNNKNSNLNAYLNESVNGMYITQSFCREDKNLNIFSDLSAKCKKTNLMATKINFSVPFIAENLAQAVCVAIYILVGLSFKEISIGVLLGMVSYAGRFWGPVQALGNIYNELINTGSYLERIFETLDEPIAILDKPGASDINSIKGDVEFSHVNFEYEKGVTIFNDLSFKINAGQSIALVGPTGAGKTTIVNLLSRFYDIKGGNIYIDGINLSDITIKSLRRNMGVMLQDPFIFSGTIKDNIRYGKLDATDDEIINAAKAVCAHDFITKFENGYDTVIGERGGNLSAGQRQLISFARTLLSDPKMLILDEATSSIDTETEMYLQQGIKALLKNRTSFLIAHRLSTIKECDKIFYISDNGIAESGTHQELLDKKGLYYNLYTAQLSEAK